jgi:hypothetical protein
MSALDDNKNFISSVFPSATLNFDTDVFGVWVSVFENVNASFNGYSFLRPIVQDITSIDYPITGKVFSLFNFEGKYPDVKFFIVSGKKGLDLYESSEVVADISNSFISGYKPLVIMPDMDFSGKIYRKQEITGLKKSLIGNDYVLSVSGEDWQATTISPVTNNTDIEYAYYDSGYSGYSNEVVTRYKFLYDDVNNSENIKNSVIDIPTQLEPGCDLRYRICRKSDPLGVFYTPELTYDGKMIIDYSKFNDEVSGSIFSSTNYKFEPIASFTFGENIFTDFLLENEVLRRPVNDATITGLEINQSQEDGKDFFNFQILPTGSFSDIYKISFGLERFNSISKDNVVGYVLTGINTGNGSTPIVINLGVNSGVYPRVIQSSKYNSDELLILANTDELIFNEEVAQETAANVDYSDEKNLVSNLEKDMKARVSFRQ